MKCYIPSLLLLSISVFCCLYLSPSCVTASDPWVAQQIEVFCDKQQYRKKVERQGCDDQSFIVEACLGNCRSYQKILTHAPHFQSQCSSCKPTRTEYKKFTFTRCNTGVDDKISIESALSCSCQAIVCD